MQKLAPSTFSAFQKDALLNQFKTIVEAGELTMRSDGDERWDSAIDRISIKYGLHLDDWKRLGPNQMGKPCGRGWVGLRGACKRGKKSDDNTAKIKESKAALADRIRARKNMSTIRSRNGKTAQGDWDIGSAYAPLKERQSTMMAARTSAAKTKMSPNPDRASRMMNKESDRARVEWGRATGDWKQKPDSTAAMDMDRPKAPTPIESGKSLKSLFAEADRIGAKYQDEPATMEERRSAKQGADRIMNESGMSELAAKASGAASISEARTRKMKTAATKPLADPMPKAETKAEVMMSKVRSRNPFLASEGITNKGDYGKIMRLYDLTDPREGESRGEAVASWKQKQKKRQEHLAKFKAERDAKQSKKLLDRRQNEKVKQNDKDRIAKNPLLHASSAVVDPDKRIATRRRLEEAVRNGTLNGAEIRRIAKTVGLQKKEQKALAIELTGIGALKKKESTKGTENKFRDEILKGRDRVAGTKPNDIIAAGAKLGMNETESWDTYKRIRDVESIARRAELAKREEGFGDAPLAKAGERRLNDPASGQSATRKMNAEAPKSSAGDRIRSIAGKLKDEQNTQKFATGKIIQAAGKIWQNHENLIKEVASIANDDLDKAAKFARLSPAEQRREMENAPVSIPNSRKSSEPRKRGRSVD